MFKEKILSLWNHSGFQKYFRNTGWMFVGQASMIISFLINIWLARYLGPENYGSLSYVIAFVGIFSFLANFGLNDILVRDLVRHPEKKNQILGTASFLLTIGGFSAFIVSIVAGLILKSSILTELLIVLYATIFIWSPFNVISAYFQANVMGKRNALAQITGTLISSAFKAYLIFSGKGIIWLTFAFAFDYILGAGLYAYNYFKSDLRFKNWSFDKEIARSFLRSSYLLMISAATGYILLKIDQVMIKFYLSDIQVGLYAVAVKLSEGWYFIPGIICNSLFPAIVNAKKVGNTIYHKRLQNLYLFLCATAVLIAIPITLLSPWIIKILFGTAYLASIPILQIYVWSGVGFFLSTGLNRYFITENYLGSIFFYNLLSVVANIVLNIILIPRIGLTGAAWATLISYLIGPVIFFAIHPSLILKRQHED